MPHIHLLMKEDERLSWNLSSLSVVRYWHAAFRYHRFHLGMTFQIILQAVCHVFALRHDAHAIGDVLHDTAHEQRDNGCSRHDGIDVGVFNCA